MTNDELEALSIAAAAKLPAEWERCADSHGGPALVALPDKPTGMDWNDWHRTNRLAWNTEACAEIAVRILANVHECHYEACGVDNRAGCWYYDISGADIDASETEDQGDLMQTWRVSTLRALVAL